MEIKREYHAIFLVNVPLAGGFEDTPVAVVRRTTGKCDLMTLIRVTAR